MISGVLTKLVLIGEMNLICTTVMSQCDQFDTLCFIKLFDAVTLFPIFFFKSYYIFDFLYIFDN